MSKKCLCLLCKVVFYDLGPLERVTASPNLQTDSIYYKFNLDCLKTLFQPWQYQCWSNAYLWEVSPSCVSIQCHQRALQKIHGVCIDIQLWDFLA